MEECSGKKKKRRRKVLLTLLCIAVLLAILFVGNRIYLSVTIPKEYMITAENYFDYQKHYECSGYASAYALRSQGEDVTGLELYNQFTNKAKDGTLAAIHLRKNLNDMGYKCSLRIGTVLDLKHAVSKGVPVLAVVRVRKNSQYLHYVPVVGYDEDYLYIADSLDYLVNAESEYYNRKVAIDDFKELWNTDVFMTDNVYLTVRTER